MQEIKEKLLEESKKNMSMIDGKMAIYFCHVFNDVKFETEDELIDHMTKEWNRCKPMIANLSIFNNPYRQCTFEWPIFSPDENITNEYIDYMNIVIREFEQNKINNVDALDLIYLKFIDFIKQVSTYSFKMFICLQFLQLLKSNCTFNEIKSMSVNRINYHGVL
jgi:hypothetical protein